MSVTCCPYCQAEMPVRFKYCGECGAALADAAARQDEFRDVTILFADVTGFTALSERLDAETVHEMMNACFEGLGKIIQAHGGHIDKYIGDSIMALFGAPTAHEDDPVRAAETALEMQAFVSTFSARHLRKEDGGAPFKMRIGLNCGTVVAGGVGAAARRDYSVMGDAVNVASRLEANAEPGTILASADFKRRVADVFDFGPARLMLLKGKERRIEAYVLQGERAATAVAPSAADVLVGRSRELALIQQSLAVAGARAPWVEIRGPLGIGKSHLVDAVFRQRSHLRALHVTARATTAARPLALMRRLLQAIFQDASGEDAPQQTRERFAAALRSVAPDLDLYISAIWFIAAPDALGLKSPDPDPLTFRLTLERGLKLLLAGLARQSPPRVLVLDAFDAADAETRNFFDRVHAQQPELPAIITTVRGEALPSSEATLTLELGGLDDVSALELVGRLAHTALDEAVANGIVRRSSGVPLFIKELVHKIEQDGAEASGAGRAAGLPGSLLGVMLSHLDRLEAEARNFLGVCAVQGAEFSADIAVRTWGQRGGDAAAAPQILAELQGRKFIERVPTEQDRCVFVQELMHNACYDRMLRRDRRDIHRAVASSLIDAAGGEHGVSPELLSNHYENAEAWLEAADQNVRAGNRAADLFANADALSRYARALKALQELDTAASRMHRCAAAANRGAAIVCLRIGDYPAAQRHAEAMHAVAEDGLGRAEALRLKAQGSMHGGDLAGADAMLMQARTEVDDAPQTDSAACCGVRGRLAYDQADVRYRLGRNAEAATFIAQCRTFCAGMPAETIRLDILEGRLAHTEGRFDAASSLYERAYHAAKRASSLSEEALTANCMGNAARDSGRYGDAEAHFRRALDVWSKTGQTEAIAGAHNNLANLAISRGDHNVAAHHYCEALEAFDKIGNAAGRAIALMNLAILAIESGDCSGAVEKAESACQVLEKSGNRVLFGLARVIKGEALIEALQCEDAARTLESVLADYTEANHPLALAGAYRGMGRVHLIAGRVEEALTSLQSALQLFERLKRVQEAGRTEVHIAAAWRQKGHAAESISYLEQALAKFKDIGAGRDVERAEALLSEVRAANPSSNPSS